MTHISLLSNHVYIWMQNINKIDDASLNQKIAYLSVEERERANRFVHKDDSKRLIVAYGGLRLLLGRYLSLPPVHFNFKTNDHGKPYLPDSSICFNLSHSADWVVWAITMDNVVGVDIEYQRDDVDLMGLAERFFSEAEYNELCNIKSSAQLSAFYRCWTRKESFIKAIGAGLSYPLNKFSVPIQKTVIGQEIYASVDEFKHGKWYLYSLKMPKQYTGSIVLQKQVDCKNIKVFDSCI